VRRPPQSGRLASAHRAETNEAKRSTVAERFADFAINRLVESKSGQTHKHDASIIQAGENAEQRGCRVLVVVLHELGIEREAFLRQLMRLP